MFEGSEIKRHWAMERIQMKIVGEATSFAKGKEIILNR